MSEKLKKRMKPARLIMKDPVGGQSALTILRYEPSDGSEVFDFKPGQYAYIGLDIDGEFVFRLYSIASAPYQRKFLEFYIVRVDDGKVTPVLLGHELGTEILFMGPAGKFTLERADRGGARDNLLLISTGTGLAPYVSLIRQMRHQALTNGTPWPRRITVLQGVRYSADLGYQSLLRELESEADVDLLYVPTGSRPEKDDGWSSGLGAGRVNDLVRCIFGEDKSGSVEPSLPAGLTPEAVRARIPADNTSVLLCGNPGMIEDVKEVMGRHGYDRFLSEDYW